MDDRAIGRSGDRAIGRSGDWVIWRSGDLVIEVMWRSSSGRALLNPITRS